MTENKVRVSNIELLKIISIFLVIVSHFIQTFAQFQPLGNSTDDLQLFLITLLRYLGHIGNNLFFVCSAWFLVDSQRNNKKKLFSLLIDVWMVSVIIMLLVIVLGGKPLHGSEIMKCLLPTTFSNNWYITCYIFFCLLYPAVQSVLTRMSERKLLSFLLISFFLEYVLSPLLKEWEGGYFYINQLIAWIMIYSLLFYLKRYAPRILDSKRINMAVLFTSLICLVFIPLAVNILAKHIPFFEGRLLFFNDIDYIFPVTLAISALNLFRQLKLQSMVINRISSCTLFIYIIHENILLRQYYRPQVFKFIQQEYGFQHALGWIFLLSFMTFVICTLLSIAYQKTVQLFTNKIADYEYPRLRNRWNRSLDKIEGILNNMK